ncbi:hypothetical protein IVG45_04645 [Methylomonas sp. LL1]|uniref:hypothetical protein n=1 Tax=Methylomonas sp. LL1 TaxID=2785785 RepID=UPI0018C41F46|nr:hypothetical protein [Methylomonas sp. LL1]QPK64263.1 hypothetical protein IVG45_04645 [Methylomonas sp. LL1]
MKNSFFLVIPEQKNDPQLVATFAEPALRQWVAELPSANPGLATRLFQDLINDLISLKMTTANRLNALELLRQQFLMIEEYLRSRLIKSGFPKGEIEKKIFSLVVVIEKQFTIGYWSVARDLTRREVGWLQGKNTALSIQRSIKGLSGIIISHYMMGYPVPEWIWFDLHSLYRLASKLGKENTRVSDQAGMFSKSSSVEDSYKQILLLSLAYPFGLMQKEFQLVYEFIEKISDLVVIERKAIADQATQCVILADEDLPPSFFAAESAEKDSRTESVKLYLNLSKLLKLIKQSEKFCSKDEARFSSLEVRKSDNQKLSAELFDYLMQRWQGNEPQGTAFFTDRLNRYLAIGLDATHELQDTRQEASADLEILAETYSDRALFCCFEKEGVLSIGSLVSFRKIDALPHQRCLGVVCKIQLPKQDNKLIFEVTIIAQQSFSVTYQEPDAASESEPRKALLYGVKHHNEERSYIILESFMIKDGDVLRMTMGHENFPIILNGRKNIGLGYWQFECRRIMEKRTQQSESKKGYDFI